MLSPEIKMKPSDSKYFFFNLKSFSAEGMKFNSELRPEVRSVVEFIKLNNLLWLLDFAIYFVRFAPYSYLT